jgi:nitronate monooxygenase
VRGWADRRILDLFGIELPIIQAPMAGASTPRMAIAVSEAGGLGSLPCAMFTPAQIRAALAEIRAQTPRPVNLNFFCHTPPLADPARDAAWSARLAPYYRELGLTPGEAPPSAGRAPFDEAYCGLVEELQPALVSFHFGLPAASLLARVKDCGIKVIASATNVAEACYLEAHGCDAVIAMGAEAGGHRGNFLTHDMAAQIGTFALVPQIVDAVRVPVIAAGGIADGRGVAAALMLGAAAVQIGTAYLLTPEADITPAHRRALATMRDDGTALTNVFTGRPARGIINRLMRDLGPLADDAPAFPTAGAALGPLREASDGAEDFLNMWAGQAGPLARAMSSDALTRHVADDALARLGRETHR